MPTPGIIIMTSAVLARTQAVSALSICGAAYTVLADAERRTAVRKTYLRHFVDILVSNFATSEGIRIPTVK
jgi:hypothetical protein